jgi:hypothetical protein
MTRLYDKRFQLVNSPFSGQPSLMIVDYAWWADNERNILNWMAESLPRGIDHQEGMTITFDNDYDRINFLMRWGP